MNNIGEKIKTLRMENGLTQEELASRCELSKGFISQLERDLTSPSIATLVDILECLGTSLNTFFSDDDEEKLVIHTDDMFENENNELKHIVKWLVPYAQRCSMEPIILTLLPNGRSDTYDPYEGEAFGYVLSGNVIVNYGKKKYKVKKYESFSFKARQSHYIENISKTNAIVLWVTTPPNF